MRPLFHPSLVNEPLGDPGVFVDCLFERRAVLFDLGDIRALPPRKVLRVSDVFVSHAHMDHFIGFDPLLRLCLGRKQNLRLFGPPGFVDQVAHRLLGYTWNLIGGYETDLVIEATEMLPGNTARRACFRCRNAFRREDAAVFPVVDGVLREEEGFRVRGALLDHRTPCLAFALEEPEHVNVWKNRLDELGLPVGPWLQELKRAARRGDADATPIRVRWRERGGLRERSVALGVLRRDVLRIVPGQRIAYVTDVVHSPDNARLIIELARGADVLFIETPFLERDAARAAAKFHLTARQAGTLARLAGVRTVVPFHFSPIYEDRGAALRAEVFEAFGGAGT